MSYPFLFVYDTTPLVGKLGKLGQEFFYLLYKTDAAQQRQQVAQADVMGLAFLKLTDGKNADTRPYSNLLLSKVAEDSVLLESDAKFGDYLRVRLAFYPIFCYHNANIDISLFKSKYGDKYLNIFSYFE